MKDKVAKKIKGYGRYSGGLIALALLFAAAFWGPQFVFRLQDGYRSGNVQQGSRAGLELGTVYNAEGDLRSRLEDFAKGVADGEKYNVAGTEYDVVGTEYDVTDDFQTMLENIFLQEWVWVCVEDLMLFPADLYAYLYKTDFTVESWKKYIIYTDETDSSFIHFAMWYVELKTPDEDSIKLLVDTESYELYYLRLDDVNEQSICLNVGWDNFQNYFIRYQRAHFLEYWHSYYRAGESNTEALVMEKLSFDKKGISSKTSIGHSMYSDEGDNPRTSVLSGDFYYAEEKLQWVMGILEYREDLYQTSFFMGISEIADLIPEFEEK